MDIIKNFISRLTVYAILCFLSGMPLALAGEAAVALEKPKIESSAKTEITPKTTAYPKQRCNKGDYSWLTQSCGMVNLRDFDACAYLAKYPTLADIISLNFSGKPRDIDMAAASLGTFNQVSVSQEAGAYGIITTQEDFSKLLKGRPLPEINFKEYSYLFAASPGANSNISIREAKEFPACVRIIFDRITEDIPLFGRRHTQLCELPKTDKKIIFIVMTTVMGRNSCKIIEEGKTLFEGSLTHE